MKWKGASVNMIDSYGRIIDYMRISITDRCNLRCKYCMPNGIEWTSMKEILTFEEIERICKSAASLGIHSIKITGGEPLVRKDCAKLVNMIKKIPGIEKVTITTNGVLLSQYIEDLIAAGIDGINVSLDSLKPNIFYEITGLSALDKVIEGMKIAISKKILIKINSVLMEEKNSEEWRQLIQFSNKMPVDVRFIEMMPIGYGRKFKAVNNEELLFKIKQEYPSIEKDMKKHGNGPAIYYHIPGFQGSIGFISAMHGKFCEGCNRIRITATGFMKPCLCYDSGVDLKEVSRNGSQMELLDTMKEVIKNKPKAHCFEHIEKMTEEKAMVKIGG
ncbi:GTP 3',8-cyclase MoaA [Clostridium sp. Marseille-QA1073]